jgi:hypothetical protein
VIESYNCVATSDTPAVMGSFWLHTKLFYTERICEWTEKWTAQTAAAEANWRDDGDTGVRVTLLSSQAKPKDWFFRP